MFSTREGEMQIGLFQSAAVEAPSLRIDLGRGAWIQQIPNWLPNATRLFDRLRASTDWQSQERQMYDRVVPVPRLLGSPPRPLAPDLNEAMERLNSMTGWTLDRISVAYYRDGNDSVAWHGDRMGDLRSDCVMANVSLGAQRRFLLRPRGGGASRTVNLSGGDVLLLGGTIHETFEHAVPKERYAGPRIALMFRPSLRPDRAVTQAETEES